VGERIIPLPEISESQQLEREPTISRRRLVATSQKYIEPLS
jgi:hypothetical protein